MKTSLLIAAIVASVSAIPAGAADVQNVKSVVEESLVPHFRNEPSDDSKRPAHVVRVDYTSTRKVVEVGRRHTVYGSEVTSLHVFGNVMAPGITMVEESSVETKVSELSMVQFSTASGTTLAPVLSLESFTPRP